MDKDNIYPGTIIKEFKNMELSSLPKSIFKNRDIMNIILGYMDQCEECNVLVLRNEIYCCYKNSVVAYYVCKTCY